MKNDYENAVKTLSSTLVRNGFAKYTEPEIKRLVQEIKTKQGLPNESRGFILFKNLPEIKRMISIGEKEDCEFMILGIKERAASFSPTKEEAIDVTIAIKRGKEPEIRTGFVAATSIPYGKGSYKGSIHVGSSGRFTFPETLELEQIDPIFEPNDFLKFADSISDAKVNTKGIWYGTISSKAVKGRTMRVELDTLLGDAVNVWLHPEYDAEDYAMLSPGTSDVIIGGYYGKKNINADFMIVLNELESKPTAFGNL
jgi:hypothetical protein